MLRILDFPEGSAESWPYSASLSLNKVFCSNRKVRREGGETQKKEVYFAAIAPSSGSLQLFFAA